jgi:hypothetical protein
LQIKFAWDWLAGAVGLIVFYVITQQYVLFWATSIIYLASAYFIHRSPSRLPDVPDKISRLDVAAFAGLCLIAATITAIAHRPDADDAFYLSIPVDLLSAPAAPMLQYDTMHGVPSLPLLLPVYRLHSLEVLWALVSQLTALPPITIAHIVFPPVFSILSILAGALLLRFLLPKQWLLALIILVVLLVILGEMHHSYGNFAFVRMHQGKAVLVTLIVPLIFFYAWSFGLGGKRSDWMLLFASQVAALGITSSALFVAPLAAGLALAGTWRPTRQLTSRLAVGLFASAYIVVAAVTVRPGMVATLQQFPYSKDIADTLFDVLGKVSAYPQLLAFLAAWTVLTTPTSRRQLLVIPLGFLLIPLNPLLDHFIATNVTSSPTYWRVLWAVPLPIMLTVLIIGSMQEVADRYFHRFRRVVLTVTLLLTLMLLAKKTTLAQENGTVLNFFGLKVPQNEYAVARTVNRLTPPNTTVLAPQAVSVWIPTMLKHPPCVSVRSGYLDLLKSYLGESEARRRFALQSYISGTFREKTASTVLSQSIDDLCIGSVVVPRNSAWKNEIATVLNTYGFTSSLISEYEVWTRAAPKCPTGIVNLSQH